MSNGTTAVTEPDRLIRRPEVIHLTGIGTARLYDLMSKGRFPQPYRVGWSVHWSFNEVQNWIAEHKARSQIAA